MGLQLQNWNENQRNKGRLDALLVNFKSEIERQNEYLERAFESLKTESESLERILFSDNYDNWKIESIEEAIRIKPIGIQTENYAYEAFLNSQINNFSKYESLIADLNFFYTVVYPYYIDLIKSYNDGAIEANLFLYTGQDIYEFDLGSGENLLKQPEEIRKQQLTRFILDFRTRNVLKSRISQRVYILEMINQMIEMVYDIIEQINELESVD